jgi:AhpD family alkylhydroperoxidase
MMKIAYWFATAAGKVMTPMKVVYARMPRVLRLSWNIVQFEEKAIRLDPGLKILVKTLAAQVNGCAFCVDIAKALAVQKHMSLDKFQALGEHRTSPLFSDRERAALAYVEEATRNKRVAEATFESLRKHFQEWEIVEITWLNALEDYYN